jgi:hypothetical protein
VPVKTSRTSFHRTLKKAYWPDVLVLSKEQVRLQLSSFMIESLVEHETSGEAPIDEPHQWHIF